MERETKKEYFLGLDIGTDSVGYAAASPDYGLMKFKGEPVWGATTFETASLAQDRRMFRVQRRRLDRRQQRVRLLEELFAAEIAKTDPQFFLRRRQSALCRDDKEEPFCLFSGSAYTDREYAKQYPTIHHLICELMESEAPHDVRLVFHACAWLVAHRGHFLFDVDTSQDLLDFNAVYSDLLLYFTDEMECSLPWSSGVSADTIRSILEMKAGTAKKEERFRAEVFAGKKPPKEADEGFPFSRAAIMGLLCGRKIKPAELFCSEAYADMDPVRLDMDDEQFAAALSELGDDAELLRMLRKLNDCAMLESISGGKGKMLSYAKVEVYEQHKRDLQYLKTFVRKYCPAQYNEIFRRAEPGNYVAYSGNVKSCRKAELVKHANKEQFSDYLKKKLKNLAVAPKDQAAYDDMLARLELHSFLPKQRDGDNRVIPQQLYRMELKEILTHAAGYLPFLEERDADGLTVCEKILSVFDFKVPYFVGPLGRIGKNVWFVRKAEGRIYPWNFAEKVDLDASEQEFIRRMTNTCTYLPGEDVLPEASLLYSRFTVLNEINNLKINGSPIPVEAKQLIYTELFRKKKKVTVKAIRDLLRSRGLLGVKDELSGVDETIKSSLRSEQAFAALMRGGKLTEADAERIINRAAYSEDSLRLRRWLGQEYPQLTEEDRKYLARLDLKGFGRLSRKLLEGIFDADPATGEARSIIDAMWQTNENLMQLLSDRYAYREAIRQFADDYYSDPENRRSLSERMGDMWLSNAVKRQVFRALDVTSDVVKAMGCPPEKIFVEMARGATADQKGKRTKTRKQQLLELYQTIKTDDVRELRAQLDAMGDMADNRLQSDRLFLYYLQLGKCLYTGAPIDVSRLTDGTYNIEHIYPQSQVKDDSILNNEILVLSEINGLKSDSYPVPDFIRHKMRTTWDYLKDHGLMTEEKHRRLTRAAQFTAEEQLGFINRQLVETRQSTKAVAELLHERYPDTEIVYVKAGLVSDFRKAFDLLKCRAVNDLHHARDAYLNIVVGNVYHERFSRRWFKLDDKYNVQVKKIFSGKVGCGDETVWNGQNDLARVKQIACKNAVHLTRYAFCRRGGFFDQQPVKAAPGLVPLKDGMPTEVYGGYNKPTASFFLLAKYSTGKKTEVSLVPVELLDAGRACASEEAAAQYAGQMLARISGKPVSDVTLPLHLRRIKVNTVFCLDGLRMVLSGKSSGGAKVLMSNATPLLLSKQEEDYIKSLDSFHTKMEENASILPDQAHDGIGAEKNLALYRRLTEKLGSRPFSKLPANQSKTLKDGEKKFAALDAAAQVRTLLNIVGMFSSASTGSDLTSVGGSKNAGVKTLSYCLSNWKKTYTDVRIVDQSASGLFERRSGNLLELL